MRPELFMSNTNFHSPSLINFINSSNAKTFQRNIKHCLLLSNGSFEVPCANNEITLAPKVAIKKTDEIHNVAIKVRPDHDRGGE